MNITQRIKSLFTAATALQNSSEPIKDSKGRLCNVSMFSDVQLARDRLIKQEITEAKRRAVEQGEYHHALIASISEFFRVSAEEHSAKGLGDEDGVSMISIDGLQRIKLVKAKSATANEKLMIAKTLLEKLVEERGANIEPFFKTLALSAFETSSTGQMRLDKVMELKNLRCDYPEWLEIKAALDKAIEYVFKKRYVVFYERESIKDSWVQIPLNLHNN
jgi:transcriptional regulator of acetoin/glycerol metabolism